jgi:archaellum component FlaC
MEEDIKMLKEELEKVKNELGMAQKSRQEESDELEKVREELSLARRTLS